MAISVGDKVFRSLPEEVSELKRKVDELDISGVIHYQHSFEIIATFDPDGANQRVFFYFSFYSHSKDKISLGTIDEFLEALPEGLFVANGMFDSNLVIAFYKLGSDIFVLTTDSPYYTAKDGYTLASSGEAVVPITITEVVRVF